MSEIAKPDLVTIPGFLGKTEAGTCEKIANGRGIDINY